MIPIITGLLIAGSIALGCYLIGLLIAYIYDAPGRPRIDNRGQKGK